MVATRLPRQRVSGPVLPDLRRLRPSRPLTPREAADAREDVARDAGLHVLDGIDLERRLAAIAEVRVAAIDVLDEPFCRLRIKLHLLRPLPNRDGLFSARTRQEDVVRKRGLDELANHVCAG